MGMEINSQHLMLKRAERRGKQAAFDLPFSEGLRVDRTAIREQVH
jgi:hypothetical protein